MELPIKISRETEFYQGYIRFKMSVSNNSPYVINDVTLEFIFDEKLLHIAEHEEYSLKKGKFILGNIYGNKSKTFTILFDPLNCAKATDIQCHLMYTDHEGGMASTFMEPKEISVVCPIMKTDCDINIGRLKEFIKDLPCKDSRVYEVKSSFDVKKLAVLAREVVEKRDVRHIRTLHTRDGKTCEIWYYGRTKVEGHNIVIKISINATDNSLELFAATQTAEALTGLLADVGRELRQTLESRAGGRGKVVTVHIKGSFVQHSNLLDMCDMDGTCDLNVIIKDSVIQHSSIAYVDEEARLKGVQEERECRRREEEEQRKNLKTKKKRNERKDTGHKLMFIPLLIIIIIVGYWTFSPLLADNSDKQNTWVINSLPAATEITPTGTEDKNTAFASALDNPKNYTNSIGMELTLIPAGEFEMGSDEDSSEQPVHEVIIEQPFYLGKYEVTQEQWTEVMGNNPSTFKKNEHPVETISWNDVQEFIHRLNEKEGTDRYRLPSEAEWEYACRAGTTTKYSFGDNESILGEYAWYHDNSEYNTHPVGQKKSNSWGLYDMHGNVWEWCQDMYHDSYEDAPTDGRAWETGSSSYRVVRGGVWSLDAWYCRSACNAYDGFPGLNSGNLGFRILMEV